MGTPPNRLEGLRARPGHRIPKGRYTSRVFMQLERERLWPRTWLLAAHTGELAETGDFVVFDIDLESILIVRGEDGSIRAFHNVCQHRGNRLCPMHRGRTDGTFRCGYHHWEYGTDGALRHVPRRDDFGPSFSPAGRGLEPVRCETAFGFVFVCLDPDVAPLERFVEPVRHIIEPYRVEGWTLVQDSVIEVAANWKTSSDVNNEAYHLPSLHPQALQVMDPARVRFEAVGSHTLLTVPIGEPASGSEGPMLADMLRDAGVDPEAYRGRPTAARRALQAAVRAQGEARGHDYAGLSDDQMTDNNQLALFPNVQLNLYVNQLLLFRHRPHPTDPDRAYFDQQVYERSAPGGDPPTRPVREELDEDYDSMGEMMAADLRVLHGLQRGMHSAGFVGLELCGHEAPIRHLHETLDLYLFDHGTPE